MTLRSIFFVIFAFSFISTQIKSSFAQQQSLQNIDSLLDILKDTDDLHKAQIYTQLGGMHNHIELQQALEYNQQAFQIFFSLNNDDGMVISQLNLAIIFGKQGNYFLANKLLIKVLKKAEQKKDSLLIAKVEMNFGQISITQNDYWLASKSLNRALDIFQRNGTPYQQTEVLQLLGQLNVNRQQYDSARTFFEHALEIDEKTGNIDGIIQRYRSISKLYYFEKNYQNSLLFLFKVHAAIDSTVSNLFAQNCLDIALVYSDMQENDKAIRYAQQSYAHAATSGVRPVRMAAALLLSKLAISSDDYKKAYQFSNEYALLKDTLTGLEIRRRITTTKDAYEIEKRQNMIKNLEEEKRKNELIIEKGKNLRIFIISILGSVLLIGIILWQRYQKRYQNLENQNLKTELNSLRNQVNPHFLFNTLNNIYVLTRIDVKKAAQTILMLSDLMRYQLYECSKERVPLTSEIQYIKNLIELEQLRHTNLSITFKVDGAMNNHTVPPFLFVPFLENAFKHGFYIPIDSFIFVEMKLTSNALSFVVKNTKKETEPVKQKDGGIGLTNIRRRLVLMYPQRHELSISDKTNVYKIRMDLKL